MKKANMVRGFSVVALLFCFLLLDACDNYGKEKKFNGTQVFYTQAVTENEADILGAYLISTDFADGGTKTVQLNKSGTVYEVRMVVLSGYEQDPDYRDLVKAFAAELSGDVFNGSPVNIHLCNDKLETLVVVPMQ